MRCTAPCRIARSGSGSPVSQAAVSEGVHPVEQAAVHGLQVRHVEPTTNPGTVVAAAGTLAHRLPPGGWFSGDRRQGRGAPLTVLNLQVNLRSSRPRVNPAAPRRSARPPTVHPGAHLTPLA
jgi:hypothetical protein